MPPRNSSQLFQRELYNSLFLMGIVDLYWEYCCDLSNVNQFGIDLDSASNVGHELLVDR